MDCGGRQMKLVLIFFLLLSVIKPCYTDCNIPPKFWCDTADIAKQCEVFEQCQKWRSFRVNESPLVDFTLYYESLCMGCKDFFVQNLGPTFQKVHSIMNLTLVPYGNADETKVGDKWKFVCQHGPAECTGNAIETCTINIVKNITVYFPFLLCMEASALTPIQAAKSCFQRNPVPIDKILTCSTSDEGNEMQHEMAVKTDALQPQHTGVPWVTLNGVHTDKIQEQAEQDLTLLICSSYTGQFRPPACQDVQAFSHALYYNP